MISTRIKFTYGDYLQLPEDKRYELIEGEFFMVPSPGWSHQTISARLFRAIDNYVRTHKLGEVRYAPLDVVLSEENVLQPDILFVSRERLNIITERNIQGAPDLVVEILSPATAQRDKELKQKLYARFGVQEYWLADPIARTIEVMSLAETGFESVGLYHEGAILRSPLLRGLPIGLQEIFSGIQIDGKS
ncbi:Uma2 family endonuclease [Dehalococcoidia bacterium]|nr:Uma2 family endonuclease [Dehalococcoidia bacterium]MCL0038639.1 Uma2 family endonuclease [Dehalococcoidia bacterium]MCL0056141.1 Uma2 family endonuclease [Dehalococcoidia bacterium]